MDRKLKQLREQWERMQEGVHDKHIFKAVFTAGSPGSGKTTASKKLLGGTGFREVNIDRFIEFLAKRDGMDLKRMDSFGPEFFSKVDSLVGSNKKNYVDGRLPLIIDGTGRDLEKIVSGREELEEIGYECCLLFVMTSLETALERNRRRERSVDESYLKSSYAAIMDNLEAFRAAFGDRMFVLENEEDGNIEEVQKAINRFIESPVTNDAARAWYSYQGVSDGP